MVAKHVSYPSSCTRKGAILQEKPDKLMEHITSLHKDIRLKLVQKGQQVHKASSQTFQTTIVAYDSPSKLQV